MNTSINYSGFIDMIQSPGEDIESHGYSEKKQNLEEPNNTVKYPEKDTKGNSLS